VVNVLVKIGVPVNPIKNADVNRAKMRVLNVHANQASSVDVNHVRMRVLNVLVNKFVLIRVLIADIIAAILARVETIGEVAEVMNKYGYLDRFYIK
jgi:hypothetical protein